MTRWKAAILAGMLALGVLLGARPAEARYVPQPCRNAYSEDQEIALGKKAEVEVYRSMPVLPETSPVTQYVEQLGASLAEHAPGFRWRYRFHVVNEEEINAFALPGGAIFVNLGTIRAAETEAQLAGVMAHEISHVAQRHSTCNATRQRTSSIFAGLGQIAAGVLLGGAAGDLAAVGIGAGANLGYLRMSRTAEKQADLMGVDILYDADYDPRALPQFFEVIESKYGKGGAQFLSDHPNPGNRVEYVNEEIDTLPRKAEYRRTSAEFTSMKKDAAAMHVYTAKEIQSGAWKRGGTASGPNAAPVSWVPAGDWERLSDTGFTLERPANWDVFDGPGTAVTIAPKSGIVSGPNGDSGIACGVLVDTFQPANGASLEAATEQLLASLRQQNPSLQPATVITDTTVDQRPAKSVELRNVTAGTPERDWLVALQRNDGTLSYAIFVAPEQSFEALRPAFERILQSFSLR